MRYSVSNQDDDLISDTGDDEITGSADEDDDFDDEDEADEDENEVDENGEEA